MSDAYQCERCGSLSPGVAPFVINIAKTDGEYVHELRTAHPHSEYTELCEGCRHKFEQFLDGADLVDQEDGDR